MVAQKIDLKKEFGFLYKTSAKEFTFVDVPPMNFLMIDGHGNPNTAPAYGAAVEALYTLAYTLKFSLKPLGYDFSVAPLEGLWWMPDMNEFTVKNKDNWDWSMMIAQPEFVTSEMVEAARLTAIKRKGLPTLSKVRLECYHEGRSVQILYFGAYADEGPTILRMHAFIKESGHALTGKHHEIYLGDPRRNPPEKLKTIIRQPVGRDE